MLTPMNALMDMTWYGGGVMDLKPEDLESGLSPLSSVGFTQGTSFAFLT
jgi:hypothetical protein